MDDHAISTLMQRLLRFERLDLTAIMVGGYDPDPGRQQRLQSRARVILETAVKWFPKPALVRADITMAMFEKRAKAFAAVCNFLADSPVVLDEVIRDKEGADGVDAAEEEWEGFLISYVTSESRITRPVVSKVNQSSTQHGSRNEDGK
ncbi:hypothetical protein D6D21_01649 [Aureobasidium pullulans]|uniref:Uncharacterized protein n=1 Tax=Aureobasidium pullulans TaxID=5580 RepID=A0AB74J8N7_AURPU|nr:hypothetical protein D6D21_01649 [Aureobasidium pullulans]